MRYYQSMPVSISKESKDRARDFIQKHPVGVVATSSKSGIPHAAAVYFVLDEELDIYFVTKEQTTKYKNISENPHVSIVMYDAENQSTLQTQGNAELVEDTAKFLKLFSKILNVSSDTSDSDRPPVSKLFAGDYFMFKISPTEVKIAEYTKPDKGDLSNLFEIIKP